MVNQEIQVDLIVPPGKYWLVAQGEKLFEDKISALGEFETPRSLIVWIYVHPDDHERARERLRRKFDKATWPPPCVSY
jgi:hypothetical protein